MFAFKVIRNSVLLMLISKAVFAANCSINAAPMSFPPYDIFKVSPVQSQSEINILCDSDVPYAVKVNAGMNSGGDFSSRHMTSGEANTVLFYNLYLDSNHTRIWGDGNGFSEYYQGLGSGRTDIVRVFGQIPARQRVGAGLYTDSVVITIEW